MRQRLSASDAFHHVVDGVIRRSGGPGNLGQLRIHLDPGYDRAAIAATWAALGQQLRIARAPVRRWCFQVPRQGALAAVSDERPLAAAGLTDLRTGLAGDEHLRLRLATDGVVVTWRHTVADARGIQGLLMALPQGGREPWQQAGYRADADLPPTAALRGQAARGAVALLKPLRLRPLLRPAGLRGNHGAPLACVHLALGAATATVDERVRASVGRFGETAFLLAAVAGALAELGDGQIVFPLAADTRRPGETRLLANAHSFLFLAVDAGLARSDLSATARHLRDAHKAWIAADGSTKLLASLSWLPLLGERIARYQLGFGRPGLLASACVANSGRSLLGDTWFGTTVRGIDHVATVPGHPGVAVLFHRDVRGLCVDVVIAGRLAQRCPAEQLAERIRWHLVERPLTP